MANFASLARLMENPKTAKFVETLKHADLPKNWADDPEIVKMAEDAYREMGEETPFYKAWKGNKKTVDNGKNYYRSNIDIGQNTGNEVFVLPTEEYAKDAGDSIYKIQDGTAFAVANPIFQHFAKDTFKSQYLPRLQQSFFSPLAPDEYIRVTNNPKEFGYAQKGKLKNSVNHATGEEEYGLSVAKEPEFSAKYAYIVKGKKIADGTDGEPVLDVLTVKPTHEKVKDWNEVFDFFEKGRRQRIADEGLTYDDFVQQTINPNISWQKDISIKSKANRGTFNPEDKSKYRGILGALATGGAAAAGAGEAQASDDAALARFNELAEAGSLPGQRRAEEMALTVPVRYAADPGRQMSLGARAVTEGILGAPGEIANAVISPFTDFRFQNPGVAVADAMGQAMPVSGAERTMSNVVRGASDALPYVATGAGLAKLGQGMVSQGVGRSLADSPKIQAMLGGLLGLFGGE